MAVTHSPRIGIVVPLYNEEKRFDLEYWSKLTQSSMCDWLFIDDGSSDETPKLLGSLIQLPSCSFVGLEMQAHNLGKAETIRRGLLKFHEMGYSSDDFVGFLDADSAFPIEEVGRLIRLVSSLNAPPPTNYLHPVDALWSSRVALAGRQIERNLQRHFLARILHTLIAVRHPRLPYDTQSGFKFFRASESLFLVLSEKFRTRWFFEIEILLRYRNRGFSLNVREEPLEAWKDIANSKIQGRELIRVASEYLKLMVI